MSTTIRESTMATSPEPSDPIEEAVRLHERGLASLADGQLPAARESLERAVELFVEASGPRHPDVANVLNALGVILLRQNDITAARRCFRRAWRICRPDDAGHSDQSSPVDDVEVADDDATVARIGVQALSNLGNLEREAGHWDRAGRILRRAVRLARVELGPADLDTANALNNLGMWCKFTGRFARGRRCYRRAMAILRRHHGPAESRRSPEIASLYHNLGGLEHTAGQFAAGEPYARKSVAIRRRAVGSSHLDYAADIGGLAAIIADQGRADEAEPLYREALDIFERNLGDDHYEIAVLLHNLAAVEVARERFESALDHYRRAAVMKRRWLGPDHPDLALTLHNLAVLSYELGHVEEAKPLCAQALAILQRHLVATHPTLIACHELAHVLKAAA